MDSRPRITHSARRHGIRDEDILHAYTHWIFIQDIDDGFSMIVGPACDAALLEVGFVRVAGEAQIVHAMFARPKFLRGL